MMIILKRKELENLVAEDKKLSKCVYYLKLVPPIILKIFIAITL